MLANDPGAAGLEVPSLTPHDLDCQGHKPADAPPPAVSPSSQDIGHMQSDIDAQLTSFFEETPPRDFAKVMRGYDPHQVDEHIRQLASEVRRHQEDALAARRELADAHRPIRAPDGPTRSGHGARA